MYVAQANHIFKDDTIHNVEREGEKMDWNKLLKEMQLKKRSPKNQKNLDNAAGVKGEHKEWGKISVKENVCLKKLKRKIIIFK